MNKFLYQSLVVMRKQQSKKVKSVKSVLAIPFGLTEK